MSISHRCKIEEVELNVWFDYEPAQNGGQTDPSFDESFEVTAAKTLGGDDIYSLLSTDQKASLDQQLTDIFEQEKKDMQDER